MRKSFVFYTMCALSVMFFAIFLWQIFTKTGMKVQSNIFPPVYDVISVIAETEINNNDDILIEQDGKILKFDIVGGTLNKTLQGRINSINLLIDKNFKNEIKSTILFNGVKTSYYQDFSKFKKGETEICKNSCKKYYKYELPYEGNFSSVQNAICNTILNIISGKTFLLIPIPFILMFLALIYFLQNDIKRPKISPYIFTVVIFIFGTLLYSNGLNNYLPWGDEYYTMQAISLEAPFIEMFKDPGNPPLFYILFKGFIKIFPLTTVSMRVFPLIISMLFIVCLWLFLKQRYGIKTANLGMLLAFINIPLIYRAQEARSYILQALIAPCIVFALFNILEKNRKKDYILYGVLAAVAVNIHYYEILFLGANFIFASVYLAIYKRYKDILKFLFVNVLGGLFFLPYFVLTSYNEALIDTSFNDWIPKADISQLKKCISYLFGGLISFLISILFFIGAIIKKDKMQIYLFFAIIATIIEAVVLSYIIRPIIVERYFTVLAPLFVMFLALVFSDKYKNKFAPIFFLIWILIIQAGSFEINDRQKGLLEMALDLSGQYKIANKEKNVYATVGLAEFHYFKNKEDKVYKNVHHIISQVEDIEKRVDEILKKDKNAVIFTQFIIHNDNYDKVFYLNSACKTGIWKIQNKK